VTPYGAKLVGFSGHPGNVEYRKNCNDLQLASGQQKFFDHYRDRQTRRQFRRSGPDQTISPNQSLNVATFNAGTLGQDRWGWVFLDIGGVACQIYAESTALGLLEASFGYFNSHSSEGNSNPSPFADGVASAEVPPHDFQSQFVYTLNSQP
jgi:hypothetical protein